MKDFISGLLHLYISIVFCIPIVWLRLLLIKPFFRSIGNHTALRLHVDVKSPRRISIGCYSTVNKHALLDGRGGLLSIGNCVDVAQDAQVWTLQHDYNSSDYRATGKPVTIDDYAWIGARSIILPGVTIGRGAVVGAGAVVTKNVDPFTVVVGVPAKPIAKRNSNLTYKLGKWRWFQ